jgi:hypothetical protein
MEKMCKTLVLRENSRNLKKYKLAKKFDQGKQK